MSFLVHTTRTLPFLLESRNIMKTNEIRITIASPQETVFEFTLEPKNTPLWVGSAGIETVDTQQIRLGTIYSNNSSQSEVTDYSRDKFIELSNKKTGYTASYSYRKIDAYITELIFFENMKDGSNLVQPMEQKSFEKLKELLEK